MNEESSIDIYKPCVKQTASGKLLYNTGSSAWCSGMTRRDGMGVRVGQVTELQWTSHLASLALFGSGD